MAKKKKNNTKWLITITVLAFTISFVFSLISEITLSNVNLILGRISFDILLKLSNAILNSSTNEAIKILNDIYNTGSNDIYVVKDELGKQILLPGIKEVILKVDIENVTQGTQKNFTLCPFFDD